MKPALRYNLMTFAKQFLNPKFFTLLFIGGASLSLVGCTTFQEEQAYAEKGCKELRLAAKQDFSKYNRFGNVSNTDNSQNDVFGALVQSDKSKQKSALRKTYNKRCR